MQRKKNSTPNQFLRLIVVDWGENRTECNCFTISYIHGYIHLTYMCFTSCEKGEIPTCEYHRRSSIMMIIIPIREECVHVYYLNRPPRRVLLHNLLIIIPMPKVQRSHVIRTLMRMIAHYVTLISIPGILSRGEITKTIVLRFFEKGVRVVAHIHFVYFGINPLETAILFFSLAFSLSLSSKKSAREKLRLQQRFFRFPRTRKKLVYALFTVLFVSPFLFSHDVYERPTIRSNGRKNGKGQSRTIKTAELNRVENKSRVCGRYGSAMRGVGDNLLIKSLLYFRMRQVPLTPARHRPPVGFSGETEVSP